MPLDGPYRVLLSEAVRRVPVEAFAGWKSGEGGTGAVGRGPRDPGGEAVWPEEEAFEGVWTHAWSRGPTGPRIGMRRSPLSYRVPA